MQYTLNCINVKHTHTHTRAVSGLQPRWTLRWARPQQRPLKQWKKPEGRSLPPTTHPWVWEFCSNPGNLMTGKSREELSPPRNWWPTTWIPKTGTCIIILSKFVINKLFVDDFTCTYVHVDTYMYIRTYMYIHVHTIHTDTVKITKLLTNIFNGWLNWLFLHIHVHAHLMCAWYKINVS